MDFILGVVVTLAALGLTRAPVRMWADRNGAFSHAKFWSTVAFAVFTWVVCRLAYGGTISWEMMLAYAAVVGGSELAKKFMTMWFETRKGA